MSWSLSKSRSQCVVVVVVVVEEEKEEDIAVVVAFCCCCCCCCCCYLRTGGVLVAVEGDGRGQQRGWGRLRR